MVLTQTAMVSVGAGVDSATGRGHRTPYILVRSSSIESCRTECHRGRSKSLAVRTMNRTKSLTSMLTKMKHKKKKAKKLIFHQKQPKILLHVYRCAGWLPTGKCYKFESLTLCVSAARSTFYPRLPKRYTHH